MGYNHGKAEYIFKKEWSEKEKLYRELGMTQEQISSIYEMERIQFNSDRTYYENCVICNDINAVYEENFQNFNAETWIEVFDEEIYLELKKLSETQLKAFYLYKVCRYTQIEISSILLKDQSTICRWINKIDEFLKEKF